MTMSSKDPREPADKAEKSPEYKDQLSITHQQLKIGSRELGYTAVCGTIVLREQAEKEGKAEGERPRARVSFVAYTLDGVDDRTLRPITFSFNGGPGSSSVWLHLGVLGPRRVQFDVEGHALEPPGRLVSNEFTLLEASDLVFIDPVGTGHSRMIEGEKATEYHDFKRDLESIGEFIRLYCSRYGRWASPKYLIGESYGSMRAAGLAGHLLDRYGMYLNGLMLVSCALNFQAFKFDPGNDLPHVMFLPTYTATAWYHKRLAPDLQAKSLRPLLAEVEKFAGDEYANALFLGARLAPDTRKNLVAKVARYTGLSPDYVERTDLRIEIMRFCKELLRDRGLTVGRLDCRYTGVDRDAAGEHFEQDPTLSHVLGPFASAINDYIRGDLKLDADLHYEVLRPLDLSWSWADFANRYASVVETIRRVLSANPKMRVLAASGYYDLDTPYFATDHCFDHLGVPPELSKNIAISYYEAGHMMYLHRPSLERLSAELRRFVTAG